MSVRFEKKGVKSMKKLAMIVSLSAMLLAGSARAQSVPPLTPAGEGTFQLPPTPDALGMINTVSAADSATAFQQADEWSNYENDTSAQWQNALLEDPLEWAGLDYNSATDWLVKDVYGCPNNCDTGTTPTDTETVVPEAALGNAGYLGNQSIYTDYVTGPAESYATAFPLDEVGYGAGTATTAETGIEGNGVSQADGDAVVAGAAINSAFVNQIDPAGVLADQTAYANVLEAGTTVNQGMSEETAALNLGLGTIGSSLKTVDPEAQGEITSENANLLWGGSALATSSDQLMFGGGPITNGGIVGADAAAIGAIGLGLSSALTQGIPSALHDYENGITDIVSNLYDALTAFQSMLATTESLALQAYQISGIWNEPHIAPVMSSVMTEFQATVMPELNGFNYFVSDYEGLGDIVFHDSFQVVNDSPDGNAMTGHAYNLYLDLRDWEAAQKGCLTSGECDDPYPGFVVNNANGGTSSGSSSGQSQAGTTNSGSSPSNASGPSVTFAGVLQ